LLLQSCQTIVGFFRADELGLTRQA
jgi:hypothetical protein